MEETSQIKNKNSLNYYKYFLIAILVFSFSINLYYFFLTKDQPLWWDESEYMSTAKSWAFDIPYKISPQRPPLFPLLGAITFKLGLSDLIFKFLFVLVPTVLNAFVVYLIGKEMFNEKVGIVAAFIMSVFWSLVFWTARFHPDSLALLLQMLSIYFFWLAFVKYKKTRFSLLTGLFAGLAFLVKIQSLLIFPIFGIFLIVHEKFGFLKKREFWYTGLVFFITILPYLVWNFFRYGSILAFFSGYTQDVVSNKIPFAWNMFNFVFVFTEWPYFILFLIGIGFSLFALILSFDLLIKGKNEKLGADFFSIITILVVLSFFIFYMRIKTAEERWLYLMAPFIFLFAGKSLDLIYEKIKKYNKIIAAVLVVALLFTGAYFHIKHADQIIEIKKESYLPVKLAALWMKENSDQNDRIFSISFPQTQYYSDRETLSYWPPHSGYETVEEFVKWLDEVKPKFLTISIFENHPEWIVPYVQSNPNRFIPVQGYFLDPENKQLTLAIYEIKY